MEEDKDLQEMAPETQEMTSETVVPQEDRAQQLLVFLKEITPEEYHSDDVIGMAESYIRENHEMNVRMAEAIAENPGLAQAMVMIANGKMTAGPALARYLGRDFFTHEEGSEEYEAIAKAEAERVKEREEAAQALEAFQDNFDESMNVLKAYAEEQGMEAEKFRAEIESFILEILDGKISKETFAALDKAIHYDKDTEDAYNAGQVAGRNMNINAMRREVGDGLPKAINSAAPVQEKPKRKVNPLLERALNA